MLAAADTLPPPPPEDAVAESGSIAHVLICGSVDDGKSTLIGRLLWDSAAVHDDQAAAILDRRDRPDFSRLTDGLIAEREQGITIDIAWRYLDAGPQRLVVIDSPGHEQYTRNMASGASHADHAVLLVGARHGIKQQTRRHAALLSLFGVRHVVLAVNKMDLVGWSEDRFREIEREFRSIAGHCRFETCPAVPICATDGDNIVAASARMPWHCGGTLLNHVAPPGRTRARAKAPLRFPVQYVLHKGNDFRGLAGTVASGTLRQGDRFIDPASGQSARIARITTMGRDLEAAGPGQAITIVPDRDLDVSRGAVLASPDYQPALASKLRARIVWTSETHFDPAAGYLLRTSTDLVPLSRIAVSGCLDLASMTTADAAGCGMNELAEIVASPARPIALDRFDDCQPTGSFLLLDPTSGHTVAGGVVTEVWTRRQDDQAGTGFELSRAILERGLCRDLGPSAADQAEFARRADEVAYILSAAGVRVDLDSIGAPGDTRDQRSWLPSLKG